MEDDNDFTFCQVSQSVNQESLEPKNLASGVRNIAIEEELTNGIDSNQKGSYLLDNELSNNDVSKKQVTVGSLSFNVIDTSSSNQSCDLSRQGGAGDAESSAKNLAEKIISARKPATRTKVPFEKGYSQMDWLKLTRTHPDLAGLKGQSNKRLISMSEVKQHQREDAMWTVLKGRVYNLSPYMKFHPGGVDMLMKAVGKDCTSLFNKYHAWVNAEFLLEKCLVGMLDNSQ